MSYELWAVATVARRWYYLEPARVASWDAAILLLKADGRELIAYPEFCCGSAASDVMANIRCPICEKLFDSDKSDAMPFCSARCRLIDLGRWIEEDHGLPMPPRPLDEMAEGNGDTDWYE